MGGVSITSDRVTIGDFSVTVTRDGTRPIVRCADKDHYTSIEAIDQPVVRVAVNPRGGTNELFAKAHWSPPGYADAQAERGKHNRRSIRPPTRHHSRRQQVPNLEHDPSDAD
jgi:hypothetical protein